MRQSLFCAEGQWYKGNLHAHTVLSDGHRSPRELADAYRTNGYHFLAITDHNLFAAHTDLEQPGFLLLPATERDIRLPGVPYHCLHVVGLGTQPQPQPLRRQLPDYPQIQPDKDWQSLLQEVIDDNQLAIIAHPVWSRMSLEQLLGLQGYIGMELYNHECEVECRTGWSDYLADCCLRAGRRPLLFASDDCHCPEGMDDLFGGWIQVKAKALTQQEILSQICQGSFYGSTGPEIYDLALEDDTLCVECSPCEAIHFITYECRGKSLIKSDITSGLYRLTGEELFVRCECVDSRGRRAFTNPIYPAQLLQPQKAGTAT